MVSEEQGKAKDAVRGSESVVEGLPHSIGRKHGGPPSIYMRIPTRAVWEARYRKKKDASGLTEGELKAFTVMCAYANNQGFAWPSLKTIGEVINADAATVSRAMSKAEKLGYLEKVSSNKSHPKWKHVFSTVYRVIYDHRLDTDELIDAMNSEEPAPIDEQDIPVQIEAEDAGQSNHGDERGGEQLVEVSGVARWYVAEVGRITGELRLVNPNAIDAAARAIETIGEEQVRDRAHDALITCRDLRRPAPLNLLFLAER